MRRLVAALACRNGGSRLYGKPLQNIDVQANISVLEHIVSVLKKIPQIDDIVLGISEGHANKDYFEFAETHGLKSITGDQKDVLSRLVLCGQHANATDIFRVTTESPFLYWEPVAEAWRKHVDENFDATFMDHVPDGSGFEIIRLPALQASHDRGSSKHRSELCTLFIRENLNQFQTLYLTPPDGFDRKDLRLTIDNPEDLILCRAVYHHFKAKTPLIPVGDIIRFLDTRKDLKALIAPYCEAGYATMYIQNTAEA